MASYLVLGDAEQVVERRLPVERLGEWRSLDGMQSRQITWMAAEPDDHLGRMPTGRQTFAMWRLWKKNDALLVSGLLGPVTVRTVALDKRN